MPNHHAFNRFRPPAQSHDYPAFGVKLDNHVRSLIDSPDIVVRIDADDMSKRKAIQIITNLADNFPGLIEFKESRFAAPTLLRQMVAAGYLGRKTGRGFYHYAAGEKPPNR